MPEAVRLLIDVMDPRGRCNRKGLVLVALGLLGVEAVCALVLWAGGIGFEGPAAMALKAVFVWLAVSAAAKRLHDTGRSAWWILGTLLAVMVWSTVVAVALVITIGAAGVAPGSTGFLVHFALTMLPVLTATLWLHFAPGDAVANRYGACPSGWGLSSRVEPHVRDDGLTPQGTVAA